MLVCNNMILCIQFFSGNVFADSEDVRKVLRDHFTDGEGTEVSLGEIRETLKNKGAFSKGNEWSNVMLEEYLGKEFLSVEFQTSASSSRNNKRRLHKHFTLVNTSKRFP